MDKDDETAPMKAHKAAVQVIARQVQGFRSRNEKFRIFHGSTNSTRPAHGNKTVDISPLNNVIKVDTTSKTALVEPNVPMDKLVASTFEHGLVPPVVMEFPGITVGGGYSGSAGESSSFRYGYFDQSVNWVEMVLGTGEVVRASATENPDLFKGAAGAMGTLGITTLVELQLLPAKRFVKTTYHKTRSVAEAIAVVQRETANQSNDYVDAILFSKTHGAVISGEMTDAKPKETQACSFSRPWDPWYYLHVEQRTTSDPEAEMVDYIPLPEYLFRYDRGGFWVGLEAFRYFPFVPFNRLTRWFLDDFMHTRMLYRALQSTNRSFGFLVQDLLLPYSTAEAFIDYSVEELDVWPLWLCPLRAMRGPSFHPSTTQPGPSADPKPMLNIGLWGRGAQDLDEFVAQNRRLEERLGELGGRKVLYSHAYYTEGEFWSLYDRKWYEELRERYGAMDLPSVYDKIRIDAKTSSGGHRPGESGWWARFWSMWPVAGLVGIRSAIRSGDYLHHRRPIWRHSLGSPVKDKG
ncbi:FAD binding domain-containing protein [Pyricularia oryzae Y34]|nr:FAD binding domain-containing protein [Pyricularia oryzae Y34]